MKKLFWILAIAPILNSCNNIDKTKNEIAESYIHGMRNLSRISSLLYNASETGEISASIDSIASTTNTDFSYDQKLLKIYEMQFTLANEISYGWVESSVKKYMESDDNNVYMTNSGGKDANVFRKAIVQCLIEARTSLENCFGQNEVKRQDLTELSFSTLYSFNTFFFCHYFITDNTSYLNFFSSSSEKIDKLWKYTDALYSCNDINDIQAYMLASTLESTAFMITMNTLSFNNLWKTKENNIQQYSDFFNKYSENVISAIDNNEIAKAASRFSEKDYVKYLSQATKYKDELMNLVVECFKNMSAGN